MLSFLIEFPCSCSTFFQKCSQTHGRKKLWLYCLRCARNTSKFKEWMPLLSNSCRYRKWSTPWRKTAFPVDPSWKYAELVRWTINRPGMWEDVNCDRLMVFLSSSSNPSAFISWFFSRSGLYRSYKSRKPQPCTTINTLTITAKWHNGRNSLIILKALDHSGAKDNDVPLFTCTSIPAFYFPASS